MLPGVVLRKQFLLSIGRDRVQCSYLYLMNTFPVPVLPQHLDDLRVFAA